jgi:O-antigen/teichoic acid export membrane protein
MSQSTLVKSTLILTIATLLSKILGSIFRVPLQNIAGDEVLGIFSLVYPVYMVALYLSVAGIPLAISKLIAEANTRNTPQQVKKIYLTASILALCFGLFSFTIIYSFSNVLADALGGPSTRFALIIVALTLLVAPYMAVYRGFFQGYGDMRPTAISQVLEQLIRAVLIIVAAYVLVKMELSTEIIAGGVMIGSVLGALASLIYLRLKYRRSELKIVSNEKYTSNDFSGWSRTILKISIPIAIGSVTMALFNFVDSFTVTYALKQIGVTAQQEINYLYGLYGRGVTLVQITTVFASSIILPLVPLITTKLAQKDKTGTRTVIEQTYRMTHLITWPAAMGLLALTLPLNLALYTNLEGSSMLAIINASAVFTSLTLVSTGVLQGMSLARLGAFIIVGGVLLKIILNIILIDQLGLDGAAWSTLIVYAVVFLVNTFFILRAMRFSAFNAITCKIILSSIIMGAVVGLPTLWLDVASWGRLLALGYALVAIGIGGVVYFGLLWLTGAIHPEDLKRIPVIGKKVKIKERKTKNPMKIKQSWLWAIIVLLLLASSTGLIDRWKAEQSNDHYEIIIPYEEILTTSVESDLTVDDILSTLKDAGLTTVSLSPLNLKDLEKQNIVTIFEENDLAAQLRFTQYRDAVDVTKQGYYISVPEDEYYQRFITETIEVEEITIGDEPFYFLASSNELYDNETPIGYDETALEVIAGQDLLHVFRVTNALNEEVNGKIVDQLVAMKNDHTAGLLGAGTEAIGFGQTSQGKFVKKLTSAGYYFYAIEGNALKGDQTIARQTKYDSIRLHSIDINRETKLTKQVMVDRTVRAVKERNIKSIFYHIKTIDNPTENLELAVDYLADVQNRMPDSYQLGAPSSFDKVNVPAWSMALILLAGVIFTYVMFGILKCNPLRIAAAAFMLLLAAAYFLLDRILFIQAFALIIAVLTPIYSVMSTGKGSSQISKIAVQYMKAVAISLIGITIVIGLLNGNGFMTGFEVFRGVKLVYIIPIAGVTVLVIMSIYNIFENGYKHALSRSVKVLNKEVRYWHLVLFVLVAAVGLFYISRTGNSGSVSAMELTIRQWLEDTLYIRPRTKEFLIGFPLFVVALYAMSVNRKLGKILLIPGVIGFLSIMNTFTHLHIPIAVSLLRTTYSVVLGFIVGLVFIVIFKVLYKLVLKAIARWA